MAVINHHDFSVHDENRCAVTFCLICVGFFALIGAATFLINQL